MAKKKSPRRPKSSKFSKQILLPFITFIAGALGSYQMGQYRYPPIVKVDIGQVKTRFSPRQGCTDLMVKHIQHAQSTIYAACYCFTSDRIATALIQAHQRGVKVCLLGCRSQKSVKSGKLEMIYDYGIPIRMARRVRIMHNKVLIIDGKHLLTGSFNFTKSAEESNAENLLAIYSPKLCNIYERNWQQLWQNAKPYTPG